MRMISVMLLWRRDVLEKPNVVCVFVLVQSLLVLVFNVGVATIVFASHGKPRGSETNRSRVSGVFLLARHISARLG
jgi:hypothetical protein